MEQQSLKLKYTWFPDSIKWRLSFLITFNIALILGIFNSLLLKKFDSWVTVPILSTVKSSDIMDLLWLLFACLLFLAIIKKRLRDLIFHDSLFFAGIFIAAAYLYFRVSGERYQMTSFFFLGKVKYLDIPIMAVAILVCQSFPTIRKRQKKSVQPELNKMQKVIASYIEMQTNYALLLNGSRGTGKTYFVKAALIPQLEKMKIQGYEEKKYVPIYISLYGIKAMEEVYQQIYLCLKPHLKKGSVDGNSYLGKFMLRAMLNMSSAGEPEEYFKDLHEHRRRKMNMNDFVLIFDDLDRKSTALSIDEVVGFINSFVEHDNNKILIISDQIKLTDFDKFQALKEKTIGTVIEYFRDFSDSFDDISSSKFLTNDNAFYEHLSRVKPIILDVFRNDKNLNLRTLIYFFNHYRKVYHLMGIQVALENMPLAQAQIEVVVKFTAAMCIEFKSGDVSYHIRSGLNDRKVIHDYLQKKAAKFSLRNYSRVHSNDAKDVVTKETEAPKYYEIVLGKYFNYYDYEYFESIFDFITGGDELNEERLTAELKTIACKFQEPTPAEMVMRKLTIPKVFNLSNEEYKQLTEEMFSFAQKGEYPPKSYITVLDNALRFPKILNYKADRVTEAMIEALTAHIEKFEYDITVESTMSHYITSHLYSGNLRLLAEKIKEVNDAIPENIEQRNTENLLGLFQIDPDGFYEKCYSEYSTKPIFHLWHFPIFHEKFNSFSPEEFYKFTIFLQRRYTSPNVELIGDKPLLGNLFNLVSIRNGDEAINFSNMLLDELQKVVGEILKAFILLDDA